MGWRPRRRVVAKVVFVGALSVQAVLVVHGLTDPHKRFGFRPFNESDVWSAEILRVHADLSRHPVNDGTWVYEWDRLVGASKVQHLESPRHASAGARASVDLLERALEWAVDHIPDDHDTIALEARVTTFHNTRGPRFVILEARRGADG